MDILIVAPYPPSRIRIRLYGIATHLAGRHTVTVLTLRSNKHEIQTQEAQVNSRLIPDQPATLPTGPAGMGKGLATGLAAALGCLLMLVLVLVLDWLDVTMKTSEDVTLLAHLEPLGSIPAQRDGLTALLPQASEIHDDPVEQAATLIGTRFRALYRGQRALLVTGLHTKNGATTTATRLAQSGMRVLLVDAHLREPALHEVFHVVNTRRLARFTHLLILSFLIPRLCWKRQTRRCWHCSVIARCW